jgi:hypothetical protein
MTAAQLKQHGITSQDNMQLEDQGKDGRRKFMELGMGQNCKV